MEDEVKNIKKIVKDFDNWVKDSEGEVLYKFAKKCFPENVIVEIGSWKGKSTIWLAKGSKAGNFSTVYAIDPHTGASEHKKRFGEVWTFDEFKNNIQKAGVDDIIKPIIKTSEEAINDIGKNIGLIFIDGAHEYDMVRNDFELWFPKMVDGGIMVFHDTDGRYGPTRLVKEEVYNTNNFSDINYVDSITWAIKTKNSDYSILKRKIKLIKRYLFNIIPNVLRQNYKTPRVMLRKIIRLFD